MEGGGCVGAGFMIGGACLGIIGIGGAGCAFRMKRYSSSPRGRGLSLLRDNSPKPIAAITVKIINIANCSYVI
jgi:hypothetical protein